MCCVGAARASAMRADVWTVLMRRGGGVCKRSVALGESRKALEKRQRVQAAQWPDRAQSRKNRGRASRRAGTMDDTLEDTGEDMRSYVQLVAVLNKKFVIRCSTKR